MKPGMKGSGEEKKGRETKQKDLGCTGWGEGDLTGREKPSYCILLQELLMCFHLEAVCKIQPTLTHCFSIAQHC